MKRSYEIGGRKLILCPTVHTWFVYKSEFCRELSEDLARAASLDELRSTETDDVKRSALFGEEVRLFLQILWAFAADTTDWLEPFDDWLKTVGGVDIVDVVNTVTQLYYNTLRPDRKNRGGSSDGESRITAEELVQMLIGIGCTLADTKDLTVGQAINLVHASVRAAKMARGEKVSDPDLQYKQLKEMIELIDSGEITEYDKKEYDEIKKRLKEWEDGE